MRPQLLEHIGMRLPQFPSLYLLACLVRDKVTLAQAKDFTAVSKTQSL